MRLGDAVGSAGHPEERSMSLTDSGRRRPRTPSTREGIRRTEVEISGTPLGAAGIDTGRPGQAAADGQPAGPASPAKAVTWLILPVVICLSQR